MNRTYSLPMYYGASPKLFEFARRMRLAPTGAEKRMWEILNSEIFKEYKFRRQHPIATFIADFYCHRFRLVIEVDGGVHLKKEQKEFDVFRDEDMAKYEIKVLRFSNKEVFENEEMVKHKIQDALN